MSKNNYDLDNLFKKLDNFGGIDALSELLNNPDINKINNENLPDLNEIQKVLNALENPNDLNENDLIELDNIISEWEKNDEMNKNFNKKNDFSSKNKIGNLIQDLKKAGEYKKQKDLNKNETISKEEKKKLFEQLLMGMKLKAESNEKISEKEKKLGKLMNILKNKMPNENEDDNNNYEGSRYKTYTVERKYEPKDITRFDNSSNLREGKPIITEEIINDGNKKIRKYEKKQNYQDGNTYKESHVKIIEETDNGNNNDIKFNYYKDIKDNFDEDEKEFEKEFNRKHYNFKTYNPDTKNMKNSGPIVREEIINDGNKKIRKYEKKESKNNGDTIHESHYEEVVEESNNNNIPQSNYYRNKNTFNKIEDNFDDFDDDYKLNKNVFKTYNPNNNTKFTAYPIEREEIINDGNKRIKKYEKKHTSNDGNTYKESHVEIIEETDNGNNNNNIKTNYYKDNFDENEKEFEKEFNRKHYNFKTYNPDTKNMKNSGPIVREEIINDGNKKIRKYEKKESKNNGDTIHESHYEEVVEESNNNNIPQSNYYKSQKKTYKSNKVQNNYYDDKFNNDFMDSNLDKITDHIDDDDFEREVQKMENQMNKELNDFGNNNYQNYSSKTYSKVYKKNYNNNNNYIDNQDEFNTDSNINNDFNNDNRSTTTQYSNTYNNKSYKKKKY